MRPRTALVPVFVANLSFGWNHATEAGFRKALRSNDYTLVAFIFPTQDTSKALEQEWISIQETERDNNVVSFDCSAKPKLCEELDVASYPAIRLYRDQGNTVGRYRGPRKTKPVVAFLRRALRPALSAVDSKNLTSFLSIDDIVFVAHLQPEESNLFDRFATLARQYHDRYSFAVARDVQSQLGISCYNNPDDTQMSTAELRTVESLENFVKLCSTPVIPELTRRNEQQYFTTRKSLVRYFASNDQERDDYVKEILPLAKKYSEYLVFATIDTHEYPDTLQMFGHKRGSTKVLSVQNPSNGDIFPYTRKEKISAPAVEAFLVDIINGKVKPWSGQEPQSVEGDVKHEEL